jgi:excisionase family DNA binding protein
VEDLLTTRQLQDLLQVDRVTIYRMLNDGRIRGFKVGGQWRFSRREIDAWIREQQGNLVTYESSLRLEQQSAPTAQTLPLSCVQAIQDVCADALDIAAIATDMLGAPLTEVSNSNPFCAQILSTREGRRRCEQAWAVDDGQVHTCHAGLGTVSVPIIIAGSRVAIIACCQFAVELEGDAEESWHTDIGDLAADLKLAERSMWAQIGTVRLVPEGHLERIVRLQRRMADTISEIGQERLGLLSRLEHIAEVSKI